MKQWIQLGTLAVGMLCLVAVAGHAQTVSPRTGEAPPTQTLTLDQFNRLPNEVQVIMKQHPDRFIIDQRPRSSPLPLPGQGKAAGTAPVPASPTPTSSIAKTPGNAATPAPTPTLPDHIQQQQP